MKTGLIVSLLFLSQVLAAETNNSIEQILKSEHRSERHKARDQFRHPKQTLEFFEVENDMQVVEIWPGGGGWYSEILAPYLKQNGKLYAAHFAANSKIPYFQKSLQQYQQKLTDFPEIYTNMIVTELAPPEQLNIAPAGSVDRVLTFRNVHNWMKNGQEELVFKAMFKALKSGGILGIVEHRLAAGHPVDPKALSGYVSEQQVVDLAEQAGFKRLGKSEINANPNDSSDHPAGVWSLPPSLRLKQKDRDHYLKVGESDRMTIKFIKP